MPVLPPARFCMTNNKPWLSRIRGMCATNLLRFGYKSSATPTSCSRLPAQVALLFADIPRSHNLLLIAQTPSRLKKAGGVALFFDLSIQEKDSGLYPIIDFKITKQRPALVGLTSSNPGAECRRNPARTPPYPLLATFSHSESRAARQPPARRRGRHRWRTRRVSCRRP